MNSKRTLTICAAILAAAVCLSILIFSTEPTATRVSATKKTAMRVDVVEVQRDTYHPVIVAMGTVEPAQDITLSSRVGGEVVSLSPAFAPGGYAKKGELLLQIDPSDYENVLLQRQSDYRQAVSDLNVEMGRQNVAQKDYQLLDETLSKELEALVLRRPQLNAARARVEAARAAVRQAELNLERTRIRAPFDAHVLSRSANVGSQVSPGSDLGRIVGVDTYWIVTTVPVAKLPWLTFPGSDGARGAEVRIRDRAAWPENEFRTGYLYRLVGALEDRTRMARVLVTVPDPLARAESSGQPSLMIGSFVEAHITASDIENVVRLSRDYVRANDTVWVMEDGELRVRPAEIVFMDSRYAYIRSGLNDGDRVVTTSLARVVEGAPLRLKSAGDAMGDAE